MVGAKFKVVGGFPSSSDVFIAEAKKQKLDVESVSDDNVAAILKQLHATRSR